MFHELLYQNVSFPQGLKHFFPSPRDLILIKKELSHRLLQLSKWKAEIASNEILNKNDLLYIIEISQYSYQKLFSEITFTEAQIKILSDVSKTMLYYEKPEKKSFPGSIIQRERYQGKSEADRYQRQTKSIQEILTSLPYNLKIRLKFHSSVVSDLVLLSDDRTIIFSSYDKTIRIWDIPHNKQIMILEGHQDYIQKIAVEKTEKFLFSAALDKKIIVWCLESFSKKFEFCPKENPICSVVVSNDSKYLAISDEKGFVILYDLLEILSSSSQNSSYYLMYNHSSKVKAVVFDSSSSKVYSGGSLDGILAWDVNTKGIVGKLMGQNEIILDMKLFDDDKKLLSVGQSPKLYVWNLVNLNLVYTLDTYFQEYISSIIIMREENKALLLGRDRLVKEVDLENKSVVKKFDIPKGFINQAVLRGNQVVVCEDNVTGYDLGSGNPIFSIMIERVGGIKRVYLDHYKENLLGVSSINVVFTVNFDSFYRTDIMKLDYLPDSISWSRSEKYFAACKRKELVLVYRK